MEFLPIPPLARLVTPEETAKLDKRRLEAVRRAGVRWLLHSANAVKRIAAKAAP